MRERCDSLFFTSATVAASGACLFYGAVLNANSGSASLIVYNHVSMGTAALTSRKLILSTESTTGTPGTKMVLPSIAAGFDTGLFVSLSSGAQGTVFYSKRA